MSMKQKCRVCREDFEILDEDLHFYDKVSPVLNGKKFPFPAPKLCPLCRFKLRLVWRNERGLYRRKCDFSGDTIISWISPDKPYKVYKNEAWWSDKWDARDYGRDYDFSRPFFEQFGELLLEVPWMGILIDNTENSDYVNFCNNAKNCYLIYGSNNNEDCMYSTYLTNCSDCVDILHAENSQLCFDCVDINGCYACKHSMSLNNCRDLILCDSCQNCQNCIGCVNLVGKQYYYFNEPLSKEDYEQKLASLSLGSYKALLKIFALFVQHRMKFPKRYADIINCEDCTGDGMRDSKNVVEGYDVNGVEDSKWIFLSHGGVKDSYDVTGVEEVELCYQNVVNGIPSTHTCFSAYVWKGVHDTYYSVLSPGLKNCFGCSGLHNAEYCILNKQYTKEEYYELLPRVIEHMMSTGEWGEFFPAVLCPFAYNESITQDYFPLEREEALDAAYKWSDFETVIESDNVIEANDLPLDIKDVDEAILKMAIRCARSGKLFKLNAKELAFYRTRNVPLPRKHPDYRHLDRMRLRRPRMLWSRECDKCGSAIETNYRQDMPEKVYCEKCFREELYG